jgi:hypothetical protein
MARAKQYVFSARTTEAGLKLLSEVKSKMGVGWDVYTGAAEPQFRRGVSHYSGTAGTTLPVVRAT